VPTMEVAAQPCSLAGLRSAFHGQLVESKEKMAVNRDWNGTLIGIQKWTALIGVFCWRRSRCRTWSGCGDGVSADCDRRRGF
jgi:hypothetical protein